MLVLSKRDIVRDKIKQWRKRGEVIGFVPTMGALHIGHESLIEKAKESCDRVVVSIFVNPTQFGPNEDYAKYPRQLEEDRKVCLKHNVDMIFAPDVSEMYSGAYTTMVVPPDLFKNKLCGKSRIGHFDGVATVVTKLFNIIQPDKAFFGQKDAQQVAILKKMVNDLNIPVEIEMCPIIRNEDGLACSSRNAFLSLEDRQKALCLNKILQNVEDLYKNGVKLTTENFDASLKLLQDGVELEYVEAYDFDSFETLENLKNNALIAIAAKVGNVRLIDNIILK